MTTCPNCRAEAFSAIKRHIQKTATTTGGVAGVLRGVSVALAGPKTTEENVMGGPRMNMFASVIIGGLRGGAAGCAAGAVIGETIKQSLATTYLCCACGHSFD